MGNGSCKSENVEQEYSGDRDEASFLVPGLQAGSRSVGPSTPSGIACPGRLNGANYGAGREMLQR